MKIYRIEPISRSASSEGVSELVCERISSGGSGRSIAWLAGAKHCFIHIEYPGKHNQILELWGPGAGNPRKGRPGGVEVPLAAQGVDVTRGINVSPGSEEERRINQNERFKIDRLQSIDELSFQELLLKEYVRAAKSVPDYDGLHRNSNTFVEDIIKAAGGTVQFPSKAYGANNRSST